MTAEDFGRTMVLISIANTEVVLAGVIVEAILWRRSRKKWDQSFRRRHSDS
jgi:hypothetical protein